MINPFATVAIAWLALGAIALIGIALILYILYFEVFTK